MSACRAIAIGCSAGGFAALQRILPALDARLRVPVLVCCHTGSADVSLLVELLGRTSSLPVAEARERASAEPGVVHIAPSGYHLLVEEDLRFSLSVDARVSFARPSIDVMFETAADAWRDGLVAVLMTGANADGAQGLAAVRRAGGHAIVQDPADAEYAAMPLAGIKVAGADTCASLASIPATLNELCLP